MMIYFWRKKKSEETEGVEQNDKIYNLAYTAYNTRTRYIYIYIYNMIIMLHRSREGDDDEDETVIDREYRSRT